MFFLEHPNRHRQGDLVAWRFLYRVGHFSGHRLCCPFLLAIAVLGRVTLPGGVRCAVFIPVMATSTEKSNNLCQSRLDEVKMCFIQRVEDLFCLAYDSSGRPHLLLKRQIPIANVTKLSEAYFTSYYVVLHFIWFTYGKQPSCDEQILSTLLLSEQANFYLFLPLQPRPGCQHRQRWFEHSAWTCWSLSWNVLVGWCFCSFDFREIEQDNLSPLPLSTHFSFTGVMVPGAELKTARGEDLLDVILDVPDEAKLTCLM